MICLGLILMFCSTNSAKTIDSYCAVSERLLRSPIDSAYVKGAPDGLKRRIAAADVNYRCQCEGWDNPICKRK